MKSNLSNKLKRDVENTYTCKYIGGGGIEYDCGIWQKKETEKIIIFRQLEKSFYQPNWAELKIHKDETKNKRHSLQIWKDGSYTIYPDQCGVPHIFEPIEPEKIEKIIKDLAIL